MKSIEMRASDFKRDLEPYAFPDQMKKEFFDYWSEPNKSNTKMRFELEKTWDLGRRLTKWASNNFGKYGIVKTDTGYRPKTVEKEPITELEKLDYALKSYQKSFESVPFLEMGKLYDYMKSNKFLRIFTKEDIDILKKAYGDDNYKCRCACVQWTFDFMINIGRNFSWMESCRNQFK
jgi:hypothetical protein